MRHAPLKYKRKKTFLQKLFSFFPTNKATSTLSLLLILLALPATVLLVSNQTHFLQHAATNGNIYYVSKNGTNADGLSWATAWNELNQINWSIILPGDTIVIDGGTTVCPSNYDFSNHVTNRPGLACGMLYATQLNIQKSGVSGAPITIQLATDSGHNGTAVVFGGRSSMLPYCTQNYTATGTARSDGIVFNTRATGASYITIDGIHRSGIMVYGAQTGVNLISDNSTFDTLRNMEIFDNGIYSTFSGGGYHTDYPGIFLDGSNITIDRTLIHDNGQDEIQDNYTGYGTITHAPMHDMAITDSWLYNHRESPVWPGYPFNSGAEGSSSTDCTHVDGIQIYGGGLDQQRFTVRDSIFGPLLAQGFYPGDAGNASFDNVTITNTLFINALLHNVEGDWNTSQSDTSTPLNWKISNITSYLTQGVDTGEQPHGFGVWGNGHGLTNSIFRGDGWFQRTASFTNTTGGNIAYGGGDPIPGSTVVDPLFIGPLPTNSSPGYSILANADFTPQCSICSGKGSSIHKVQDLLNLIDSLNSTTNLTPTTGISATSQLTPTPTLFLTATPTPVGTTIFSSSAANGVITAPFTVGTDTNGAFVSQSTDTSASGPAAGGEAAYTFTVATSGTYTVGAIVNAADLGSNSVYVNIDSQPTDPTMIWDIPVTTGYQFQLASWRGNGTPDLNQYVPVVFTLSAGTHTLIIRGREANTKFSQVSIQSATSLLTPSPTQSPTPTFTSASTPTPTPKKKHGH
jgi:hypothetical protein